MPDPATATADLTALLDAVRFSADGLVPAIAQQAGSGEVLMMAWMNREALIETVTTGRVCYWSRSRGGLWRKGESSGQVQRLKELRVDCDGDTLLLVVDQTGVACHTGRRSCFYRAWQPDGLAPNPLTPNTLATVLPVETSPEQLYGPTETASPKGDPRL
jgi:phosphoribosyl-AMP cyclohydrolase